MQIRQSIAVFAALVSAFAASPEASHAQFDSEATPFTIGTGAALKLDKSQIKDLVENKGLSSRSTLAKHVTKQYSGQGVQLDGLKEKEILDLWKVLSPGQRDELAAKLKPGLIVQPKSFLDPAVSFQKNKQFVMHIPPPETTPPKELIHKGSLLLIERIKDIGAMKSEADSCEAASVTARDWVGRAVMPSQISSYQQSLGAWVSACLTQDTGDIASLAGLDLTLVNQVVGILSYGPTRFCTGLLKDGKVIIARRCFMKNGEAYVPTDWWCPNIAGADNLWCTTDAARKTLQFSRASDPTTPIPLSLSEAGIRAPASFEFGTDPISLAVRSDSSVSLAELPKSRVG